VFLAADKVRMQDMNEALAKYLAWESILAEKEALDLSPFQVKQAETQKHAADGAVTARLPEAYQWLLVPEQTSAQAPVTWQAMKVAGGDSLAVRASKKLRNDDLLVATLGATILRKHLDDVLWRGGKHVAVRQIVDDFARYLYLPRLAGPEVLVDAIRNGVGLLTWRNDTFGYAESYDEAAGRYLGLRGGQMLNIAAEDPGLLVKATVAREQLEAEVPEEAGKRERRDDTKEGPETPSKEKPERLLRRYFGTVRLDPTRAGRDASRIADEVIAHLVGQDSADVTVTLEIQAVLPKGANDQVVRTVTENSRTLKFETHGFESE
jgi:hypothetical protein